jgi:hypothetical protein
VWSPIAKFALEGALQSHHELGLAKSEEWTFIALAYLRVCALLPEGQTASQLKAVIEAINECDGGVDRRFTMGKAVQN